MKPFIDLQFRGGYITMATNTTFTMRHPKQEDAQYVCNLVIASDIEDFGTPDFDLNELNDMWAHFDLNNNVWIIEDAENQIVGYAFLEEDNEERLFSYGTVHPTARGIGVGAALLQAIETRSAAIALSSGLPKRLQNMIPTNRDDAQKLLSLHSFKPVRLFKRLSITLDQQPAFPHIPKGITITPFVKDRDEREVYDTYVTSFSDHWDYVAPSFEKWVENTQRDSFSADFWFVARSEHGNVAGVALGRMREDTLFINQIGVLSAYRGLGLGLALLQHSFRASFDAGQPVISLGVDTDNLSGAYRLYEKAGMKPVHEVTICEKEITL